ncbi:pyrroline-5-carboxylate reductase [Paracoccus sp. DMF-8]|uniref:pyrroline-5-carboxylate reductase n=1 Tax=Paracoccus sp. DMF-8 TaxID=3019445 RepID=UPI0023E3AEA4|nr:pyrroline-5-carboxylate reductase [Paracoccus sp. DMF-8]MDF3607404.1 pyrroline-5-carboxylate reductase [Paracoccus sp. DMF-8]
MGQELAALNERGLVLVGCGAMGWALLQGWLKGGLAPASVGVIDPNPRAELAAAGVRVNGDLPTDPAVLVIAVKPQMMADVLPTLQAHDRGDTLVLTVAAGVTIAAYEAAFPNAPVVRAMPNTPAAIGQGISAIIGNAKAGPAQVDLAAMLMGAVGPVVRLTSEDQMDAVTALSGSGPGYVFYMIEAMAAAGEAQGLPRDMALDLARATVAGAGALAMARDDHPSVLRRQVTSPAGTTEAGLKQLMDDQSGLGPLMNRTVAAAAARGRELGK